MTNTQEGNALEPIIKLRDVEVIYNMGLSNEKAALNRVNLDIYPGEYVVLFGPSGCGKSTLLYTIAGLEHPSSGTVEVSGKLLAGLTPDERIAYYRKTIGMIFQAFYLVPHLTARDNLILPLMYANVGKAEREARAELVMDKFGIREFATRRPMMLSGGQQQRTAIGRAMMADASIILADEPVGNLDSKNSQAVLNMLDQIHRDDKKTIILVTHNPNDTLLADRIVFLRDGRVERIVNNNKEEASKHRNIYDYLAQHFPHFTPVQLQAMAIVRNLTNEFSIEAEEFLEKVVAQYLAGMASYEEVIHALDDHDPGAGLYRQKAKSMADEIAQMAEEMKLFAQTDRKPKSAHRLQELFQDRLEALLPRSIRHNQHRIDRFRGLLRQFGGHKLSLDDFAEKCTHLPIDGGVGLHPRTVLKIVAEMEVIQADNHAKP